MTPDRPAFRPDIEGLRGAAILLVVAFHAGVPWLNGGYVGVDVFFVLSGFLITGLLAREVIDAGDVDLTGFYARRARRLIPAFLVVLVATLAIALAFYAPIDRPLIASNARAVAMHYGNVLFARESVNYHASASNPFLHTWSLAVEEQFYVIWPLLFVFVGRSYAGKETINRQLMWAVAIAAVASFAASLWITSVAQPWAFFGMPTRIWEFAIGGIAALLVARASIDSKVTVPAASFLQWAGLAGIGIAAFLYHDATPYPGTAAIVPVFATAALLIGGHRAPESAASHVLGSRVLRWFGRVSYSWYLWHWPLVGLAAVLDWRIGVGGKLAWSAFALLLAVLTLELVEKPARDPNRLRFKPVVFAVGAIAASFAGALIALGASAIARRQISSPAQRTFVAARRDAMKHDCWGSMLENPSGPCVFGDPSSRRTVVLMGDSHAEHWLPAVDRLGRERGWRVVAMVKPACPVADMSEFVSARLKRDYTECTSWRREKLRRIVAMHPDLVLFSSYDHYVAPEGERGGWRVTPRMWYEGLRRTYSVLSNAGIPTISIRDIPQSGFDGPACLSRRASGVPFGPRRCEYTRADGIVPSARAAQTAAARGLANVGFVEMADRLCDGDRCSVVRRGTIVFRDDDHLTATFSRAEAPELGRRISAAFARLR